ncbi:MAG: hypothetical protein HY730_00805 [Candidatus Tectomicrobia bacterium]|uniref:Response receiver domain-containing protein n=1 Tax=Tectimicrobiota bacterium TaxID=2528274 RepID=A0A933LPB6_UNCTE|nr:hypothetical protein [Candidatus Tectomicrobia bacterium]
MDKTEESQQAIALVNFEELSRGIVARFLQTIVIVDDQAFLHEADVAHPHGGLVAPGMGATQAVPTPVVDTNTVSDTAHELDAKAIIDVFAEKGLICSVLRPKMNEQFETKTINAAERADILILDWQLQGATMPDVDAADLIEKIISRGNSQDRLRLIAVYSAEKPATIGRKLQATLTPLGNLSIEDNDHTFVLKRNRVCLFAKEGTIGAETGRIIREEDLPDRLITEFSKMTTGLLSNAALESMAALRKNMHRMLGKFHPSLDAPYLSHRALLKPAEEAESHVVPLIVAEIQSILEDQQVSDCVTSAYIQSWVARYVNSITEFEKRMNIPSLENAKKSLVDLLCKGIHEEDSSKLFPDWSKFIAPLKEEKNGINLSKLTDILTSDGSSGGILDREFACLMSVCTHYENPQPMLTLGSIVALDSDGKTDYFLCVQPSCDSVRLPDKGRRFPFLPMTKAANSSATDFGFIVPEKDGNLIDLRLSLRVYELEIFEFRRDSNTKCVLATNVDNEWIFTTVKIGDKDPKRLRWVAELKQSHAQRVANDYAREISRVGLTESEWLRRQAQNKKM